MGIRVDLWEGIRIALHSLRAHRLRTVLTTLAVGIGVATLLAILAVIDGMNATVSERLAALGSNTLYLTGTAFFLGPHDPGLRGHALTLDELSWLERSARVPSALVPLCTRSADVGSALGTDADVVITGTTDAWPELGGRRTVSGRFFTHLEVEQAAKVAVIGTSVAEALFAGTSPLGRPIVVHGRPFTVIGVLDRKGMRGGRDQDQQVVVPFPAQLELIGRRAWFSVSASTASHADLDRAESELRFLLRTTRRLTPDAPDDFAISRPEQLERAFKNATEALDGLAVGVGLITLLVGGVGIMNIMLASVRERTSEIGVRRALGARRRTIVLQFLLEAAVVTALGGALGTGFGLSLSSAVLWLTPIEAHVTPGLVTFGVLFSTVVGLTFGVWPALRAARLDPIEALRRE